MAEPTTPEEQPSADDINTSFNWGDIFRAGAERYWSDRVPTGIPQDVQTTLTGAPPPRPPEAQQLPKNWGNLNKTERWLYTTGLPWVEEQGWLDRLENLNESWVGKALLYFDILAEGVERSVGLVAQYKDAVAKNEVPKFYEEFGSVWRAGSMAYDVMGAPGVAVTETGMQTYSPLDISEEALAKARQMIVEGATTEEARAALYEDMGALAMRATVVDAIGHIAIDPLNFILPKLAPITRLHKLRADAIYRSGRIGAEAVQGARIIEDTAFDALKAAERVGGVRTTEYNQLLSKALSAAEGVVEAEAAAVRKISEATFTHAERFAIWATGGLPLSPETAARWAASGPKGWKRALPWNWFKLTPMSRANEVLVNVGIHGQALITQSKSVDGIVGAFNRGMAGALGDELGHIMMTPAGRSAQGWMKYATAEVNDLYGAWKGTVAQRDQLHAAARLLNMSADEVLSNLVKGESAAVLRELTEAGAKVADDSPFAVKALVESMQEGAFTENTLDAIGKTLTDQPFDLATFQQHAIRAIWDSSAKTAVTQLGIEEAGFFTRMTASLKTIETLAFLRLNPGYAVRNFLNNELTMLARGNWGAWARSGDLMVLWERIGVIHPRLTSGFGAAGAGGEVGLQAKRASTLIEEAFQQAQGVLGEAAMHKPNWVGRQLNKISGNTFPLDMGEYAKAAESWASIRAMTKGYTEAWGWFWRPKAPSVVDSRLADLPQDVEKSIWGGVKSAMSEAELDAVATSDNLNISIGAVMDGAAERAGISVDHINDVFNHGFDQRLAAELIPAIKSGNPEDVKAVLRASRERHQLHINNILEEEWANAYKGNLELMDVDGPGGVLRSWGETFEREFGMWDAHLRSVQDDVAKIRAMPDEMQGPAWVSKKAEWARGWNRYKKWYRNRMDGMVDGAKRADVPIPDSVIKAVDDRLAAIENFHSTKLTLQNRHFKSKLEGLERRQSWVALQDELDKMYTTLIQEEFKLSKIVDDAMANAVGGPMVPRYKSWRARVRNARNDYMMDMRQWYRTAYDDDALAALGMKNSAQYFDEVVGPQRLSAQQVIWKEEKEGLQMLAGGPTSERIQQGVARTLREGTAEDVAGLRLRSDARNVTRILDERGAPMPNGATKPQQAAITSAAESVERGGRIPLGEGAGPFRAVDIPEDIQVPFFRTSNGDIFTYQADDLTDGIRAHAAAIQSELEAEGLADTANLMGKFVETLEDDLASARLVDATKTNGYFFPDARALVPEQKPMGMTANEVWMQEGERIYNGIEEASLEIIDKPPLRFDGLDAATQKAVRDYIELQKVELGQARTASMYMAEFKRDSALLNYSRRTNFDAFTGQLFPFSFWTTHSMYNWALWSIERPAMMSTYLKTRRLFETAKGRKNLPRRMRGMGFGFKVPFIGKKEEWMGPLFFNPLKIGLPIENFTYPFERMAQDVGDDRQRAARLLERQLEAGEITDEQYREAVQTQSGDDWRNAMRQTANGRDTWMDFSQYLVAPHAPAVWAYNAARGRDFQPGPFLPATRLIKGITAMMGVRQPGTGDQTGWNIERAMRIELGLPEYDAFTDYQVDRAISDAAATLEITADQAMRAMIDRDGEIFDEMQRRAAVQDGVRAGASALGIPTMAYPPGEEISRNLADDWGEAYEKWKDGDTAHLVEFYEEHPEVKARLGLFDSPEERLTRFLVDQVNDKYYSSPGLIKSQIRKALGEEFVRNFLATDTKDPMAISPDILALWLKVIGGDPPGTLGKDALPIELAPPDIAYRADAFYKTRAIYFPDYFEQQEDYYKLKEGKPRAKYRADHPDLVQYWNWKWDFLHRNPDIAPYVSEKPLEFPSEEALREAETAQPDFNWQEWQSLLGIPMWRLARDHLRYGDALTEIETEELQDVANSLGISMDELLARMETSYEEAEGAGVLQSGGERGPEPALEAPRQQTAGQAVPPATTGPMEATRQQVLSQRVPTGDAPGDLDLPSRTSGRVPRGRGGTGEDMTAVPSTFRPLISEAQAQLSAQGFFTNDLLGRVVDAGIEVGMQEDESIERLERIVGTPTAEGRTSASEPSSQYPQLTKSPEEYMEMFAGDGIPKEDGFAVPPPDSKSALGAGYASEFKALLSKHPVIIDPAYWGGGYTHGVFVGGQSTGSPVYIGHDPGSSEFIQTLRHELAHIGMVEILADGSEAELNKKVDEFQQAMRTTARVDVPADLKGRVPFEGRTPWKSERDALNWLNWWGIEGGPSSEEGHIETIPGELWAEVVRWSGGNYKTIPERLRPFFEGIIEMP